MIGSLLYLTASRLDIMFSFSMRARYQSAPKESHLKVIKRILRYLIGTSKFWLWYSKRNVVARLAILISNFLVANWTGKI